MEDTARARQPEIIRSPLLARIPGLVHGFSTRTGGVSRVYRPSLPPNEGDLNLGYTPHDDPGNVRENRTRFLNALPATGLHRFMLLRQVHTPNVVAIQHTAHASDDFTAPATQEGDGLITALPGVLLAVGAADCIPVLVADPVRRLVAAFHAGWRGTAAGIVQRGVATMRQHYGCAPADLLAVIGPGIGPRSYAVSQDVRTTFTQNFNYTDDLFASLTGKPDLHLDLWEANRRQLLDAGLSPGNIDVLALDTAADTGRFFSHRAEHGFTGRMLGVIGLTSP